MFIELTEEDIKGSELGFSFGMRKIIKKVLDKYKVQAHYGIFKFFSSDSRK